MTALKSFHEILKSDQRQQWSSFLLSKKNGMGKKDRKGDHRKDHDKDKKGHDRKEKLIEKLNVEAGKKEAFSKALEGSMKEKSYYERALQKFSANSL